MVGRVKTMVCYYVPKIFKPVG